MYKKKKKGGRSHNTRAKKDKKPDKWKSTRKCTSEQGTKKE